VPFLSMYLVERDVEQLCEVLDADPEVALVRGDGPGRWKAQRRVLTLSDGEHALWHVPSGPIALEPRTPRGRVKTVRDPFSGWAEIVAPIVPGVPWFGPGPLGIIWLTVRRRAGTTGETFRPVSLARPWSARASEVIGLSTFMWIGNYYSVIGSRAPEATVGWWNSLRRRVAKMATQIPTSGPITGRSKSVWAFPAALEQIRRGAKRADNPT
jgi:hypothetical protein